MPPREYRLETLLGLREKKKEEAERHLGECLAALKVEQDRLAEMEAELDRMIAKREAKKREYAEKQMRGELSAQGAIAANVFIERLKEQEEAQRNAIEGQHSVVSQKQQDVDGAREDLARATQDMKALEKHKEKWQDQVKKEIQQKEDEALDDIAQSLYNRR